jgi:hypothetical protein
MTLNPFNKDEFNRESKIGIFVEISEISLQIVQK